MHLDLVEGDITKLDVDVVVNAANNRLVGGGGVDGAIHRAAGPELLAFCRGLGGCPTGEVRESPGYQLKVSAIFHTVGPVWQGGLSDEPWLLSECYRKCLRLAEVRGYKTIAFPAISCGIYGYPVEKAVGVALREIHEFMAEKNRIEKVVLCCFSSQVLDIYRKELQHWEKILQPKG